MSTPFYALSLIVAEGNGDWHTDDLLVWQGTSTWKAVEAAARTAENEGERVRIWRGREIGRLVYTTPIKETK